MIQVSRLSKRYKSADTDAVDNVDLHISEGEIFGLLGPNGAGKTTFISMLSSFLKPTSGSFTIAGLDFLSNAERLKGLIGIVPQDLALYPSLTAEENLLYFGSMYGLKGRSLNATVKDHLEILGLSDFATKRVGRFSGGMKRRVNLAASILHRPQVLFLDEPTVGVDVQSKQAILDHLLRLNEAGTTILYTSHHLNEAERFCTQVAIMDRGRIITQGSPADLISAHAEVGDLEGLFILLTGKKLRDDA